MAHNANQIQVPIPQAEQDLWKLKEDYTKAISEAQFQIQGLGKQLEELKHLYNGQLHMLNHFGDKQRQINNELHHNIVAPLQLENQQLKQQLLVDQARLTLGRRRDDEVKLQLQRECQAVYSDAILKMRNELEAQFNGAVTAAVDERMQQHNCPGVQDAQLQQTVNELRVQLATRDVELRDAREMTHEGRRQQNTLRAENHNLLAAYNAVVTAQNEHFTNNNCTPK